MANKLAISIRRGLPRNPKSQQRNPQTYLDSNRPGTKKGRMSEVKVIGTWYSPYVRRVETALKMKGVEYEYIEEDLKNKSPLLIKYNPVHKKVPVLLHDGRSIAESLVIIEYIDEVWDGPSILPKNPYERAQARFWAHFFDEKCTLTMWKACFGKGEEREKAKVEAREALKCLENELEGKTFFGGDNVGLVDITANFIVGWFLVGQDMVGLQLLTQAQFPNVIKWADQYSNNSILKEHLPDKDKLVARLKPLLAEIQH